MKRITLPTNVSEAAEQSPRTALLFVRFSSEDQKERPSIQSQLEVLQKYSRSLHLKIATSKKVATKPNSEASHEA